MWICAEILNLQVGMYITYSSCTQGEKDQQVGALADCIEKKSCLSAAAMLPQWKVYYYSIEINFFGWAQSDNTETTVPRYNSD